MNRINLNKMTKYTLVAGLALTLASCGGEEVIPKNVADLDAEIAEIQGRLDATQDRVDDMKDSVNWMTDTLHVMQGKHINYPKVETQFVTSQRFEHYFEVQGNIEAEQEVILYAEAGGNIKKIHVGEGQTVKAGQTLVTFDMEMVNKNINEVQTRLELATITFEKRQKLWEQNIGSEMQFLQAKNQKESLEQSLSTLKSQRGKSVMIAPFSGVIDEIVRKTGEMAGPGMPVLRLVNQSKLSVVADVNEKYLGAVAEGKLVQLVFPALGDAYTMDSVQLKSWGRYINPNNRTFKVNIDLPTSNPILLPNLLVEVRIRDYVNDNVVAVPSKYIHQTSDNENYVYVLIDDAGKKMSKKVLITTGKSYRPRYRAGGPKHIGMTEVMAGLSVNDELVTEGFKGIQDNIVVLVNNPEDKANVSEQ
jgi:membrane fusion protein (multidrug efflux system)